MSNFYEILEVTTRATPQEIKSAYKRLALLHHPDKNQGDVRSEEMFKLLGEAYRTLSTPRTRIQYDKSIGLHQSTSVVQYRYHEGGLYRSMINRNPSQMSEFTRPQVFRSKKKDVDHYLFWASLGLTLFLAAFFFFFAR